jgi:hypothetical protein
MIHLFQRLLVPLLLATSRSAASLILESSSSSNETPASFVSLGDISLSSLTACLRFWVNVYVRCTFLEVIWPPAAAGVNRHLSPVLWLGIDQLYSNMSHHKITLLGQQDFVVARWSQMAWHSVCLTYNHSAGRVSRIPS